MGSCRTRTPGPHSLDTGPAPDIFGCTFHGCRSGGNHSLGEDGVGTQMDLRLYLGFGSAAAVPRSAIGYVPFRLWPWPPFLALQLQLKGSQT